MSTIASWKPSEYRCCADNTHTFSRKDLTEAPNGLHNRKCLVATCKRGLHYKCHCGQWVHMKNKRIHEAKEHSPAQNKSDGTAQHSTVPHNFIVHDLEDFNVASPGMILIGTEKGLFSPYASDAKQFLGHITNTETRQKRYEEILISLQRTTKDKHLIRNLLKLKIFEDELNELKNNEYQMGGDDCLEKVQQHMEGLADLAAGSLMTQSAYTKYTRLITHTGTDVEVPDDEAELKEKVQATKSAMAKYWGGSRITVQASKKIEDLLNNTVVLNKVIELIDAAGGYVTAHKDRNLTAIARSMNEWCSKHNDESIKACADMFTGNSSNKVITDLFTFQTSTIGVKYTRYRSERVVLVDSRGNKHKMFRLRTGNEVMAECQKYLVGQEIDEQIASTLKKDENGVWCVYYLDKKIEIFTLACDRRYTYIGNVEYVTNEAGGKIRVRHLDPRVVLLIRMYRLYQRDIFKEQTTKGKKVIDLVSWLDGSNMDKSGRSDYCIQIVPDDKLMKTDDDKQTAYIRTPMSTCITWQTECTEIVTSLCMITTQDMINMMNFEFEHPDGYIVSIRYRYFVADNKAANGALGKQYGGKIRCKHCALNFSNAEHVVDYCKCRDVAEKKITIQMLWDRAKVHGRKIIKRHEYGLKRICGWFNDYASDRPKYTIPDKYCNIFNSCTKEYLRSMIPIDCFEILDEAYSRYQSMELISDVQFTDSTLKCTARLPDKTCNRECTFNMECVFAQITKDTHNLSDILLAVIYLHFNRRHEETSIKHFGLNDLEVISDAPHNIAGFDDRLFSFLLDEVTSDKVLLDDRNRHILGTTRSAMNHSNKREATLRSPEIFFGKTKVETGPMVPTPMDTSNVAELFQQGGSMDDEDTEVEGEEEGFLINFPPTNQKLDVDVLMQGTQVTQTPESSQVVTTGASQSLPSADQSLKPSTDKVVNSSTENFEWIQLLQMLLIRQCSMSEEKRKKQPETEAFIFHWASFLLFILSVDRYGYEFVSNYLHDIALHMPEQFEKISFSSVNGDMFEETFAEWKLFMRTSCHRKHEAEISGLVRRNKMEMYYTIHPALKRTKSKTEIKKLIKKMDMCNILLKKDILNSKWSSMIQRKIKELKESGYSRFFNDLPNGDILLLFTKDNASAVYLPISGMLCVEQPHIECSKCSNEACSAKAKSPQCSLCVDCCIRRNCKRAGDDSDEICQAHYNTNKRRIQRNAQIEAKEKRTTARGVARKSEAIRQKKVTCVVVSAGTRKKRSKPDTTTSSSSSKRKKISGENSDNKNGVAGACTCNCGCKTRSCPCKDSDQNCRDQCHRGKKGQVLSTLTKCSRKPKVSPKKHNISDGDQPKEPVTLNSLVNIKYRKSPLGTGKVILISGDKCEVEFVTKVPNKKNFSTKAIGDKVLLKISCLTVIPEPNAEVSNE